MFFSPFEFKLLFAPMHCLGQLGPPCSGPWACSPPFSPNLAEVNSMGG